MRYRDFEEFLECLNASGVRYLVVGAHAVAYHARPRATKDLDVYVDPRPENARRVLAAIREFFGGADLGFTEQDLTEYDSFVQLGVAPIRIDLIKSLLGVGTFEEAWERRVDARYGEVPTHYLSLDDLIAAKEGAGRDQDNADLEHLHKAKKAAEHGSERERSDS